jgi:hypothetical protein
VEFGGALGLIARLAGAGEVQSTYALQDGRWLIDSEASGTIYDYAEGSFTLLDHQSRTWFTTSFAEMARALEARTAEARQELDRARAEAGDDAPMAPPAPDEDDVDVDVGVKVSVDRTGERQQIAGYDAERLIVTVEVGSAEVAEGGSLGGTMVLVSDVWTSADFPANRVWRTMFQEHPEWADVEDLRDAGAGLQAAFALDGRIRLALEESATSVEDVGGHALLNRTSLVLVAPGAELDRAAVLAAYDQGLGPDV